METSTIGTLEVRNPINNALLYSVEEASWHTIEESFERARKIQRQVQELSIEQRIAEMMKVNNYIIANREKIITRIVEETGKARFDALASELFEVLDVIDHYQKVTPKILQDQSVETPLVLMGKKSKIFYEPLGVILVIAPWNYPFYQGIVPSLLAFLAGNAVIFKPSEVTPMKGVLEDILQGSGFLKDAIQVVYGGKEVGAKLIESKPDKIHFTGSVASGKKIMEAAAKQLIPVDLELGGKDPSIVFEDVHIERTVNGVMWGSFTGCGQSCTSLERLYVHESIFDKFVETLVSKVQKLRVSSPDRNYQSPEDCDVGSMTTEFQCQIIERHLTDAVQKGARILTGGRREPGTKHFPPTVLVNVSHEMLIMTEETFGPVLPVMKFRTEEEALRLANDSPYGLGGSVWSKDIDRAIRVARKIKCGNVSINSHMLTEGNPALPFGGVKDSGFGRYKGAHGLTTFCNSKSIIIDKQSDIIEPHWYPFTTTKYKMLGEVIDSLFARPRKWIKFGLVGLKLEKVGSKEKIQ
ncbi:MAG: aldehyde dehydrogenase family protein [Bacteroidia bacterium]|nr:aldehyde dehydrogenase family protein [Bacteroidia bacterium]